ncbi:MAG: DUF3880 domain-containing protein [Clostridiaceae bacterium]|nr:DUF3880 domain-containing protein [Clostridiaceae bacterium]
MRILYYSWEASYAAVEEAFQKLGIIWKKIVGPITDYDHDSDLVMMLENVLSEEAYDAIFTINFFPVISRAAERNHVKYLAWVYDCPHYTLFSKTVFHPCNYLFLFDRQLCDSVRKLGAEHVFYLPLAVNAESLNRLLGDRTEPQPYGYEVSFVGSLYENSMYDQVCFPEYLQGYFEALFQAWRQVYALRFSQDVFTEEAVRRLDSCIALENNPEYLFSHREIYTDMLNKKVTSMERISCLNHLAKHFSVDLFTGSDPGLCSGLRTHGYISRETEMPKVFRRSKINLNISLRSIPSGIPLRCLDILGAGGFLLSNYQPELCEWFVPGEDFVFYENEEDLLQKTAYYLEHEEQREAIAFHGWKKVQSGFGYKERFQEMFRLAGCETFF